MTTRITQNTHQPYGPNRPFRTERWVAEASLSWAAFGGVGDFPYEFTTERLLLRRTLPGDSVLVNEARDGIPKTN